MPTPPPPQPAERFAAILLWLNLAVNGQGLCGRLAMPFAVQIIARIRAIAQRITYLATLVQTGRYKPRRPATRRPAGPARPRRPDPLPKKAGWLLPIVPDAASFRSQLEYLFRDPEMVALMQAAPAAMRRPLRSLCHMLGATPPPVLAAPAAAGPPTPPMPRPAEPVSHSASPVAPAVAGLAEGRDMDPPAVPNFAA